MLRKNAYIIPNMLLFIGLVIVSLYGVTLLKNQRAAEHLWQTQKREAAVSAVIAGQHLSPQVSINAKTLRDVFRTQEKIPLLTTIYIEDRPYTKFTIESLSVTEFLSEILTRLDYDVVTDFEKLDSKQTVPQLALLNPEAAKQRISMLRTINPDIKIMLMSGTPLSKEEMDMFGGDYSMQKPVRIVELKAKLDIIAQDIANSLRPEKAEKILPEWSIFKAENIEDYPQLAERMGQRVLEYQGRLVSRKDNKGLFLIKTNFIPAEEQQGVLVWEKKNDPLREFTAFNIRRALDNNVCDVVIPKGKEANALANYVGARPDEIYLVRLSSDYKLADAEVRRKDFNRAFTRNLVTSILMRKWDFHWDNLGKLADSNIAMTFDDDQSFHKSFMDIEKFTMGFIDNYFSTQGGFINQNQLLNFLSLEELAQAVEDCERINLDELGWEIKRKSPSYRAEIDAYIEYVKTRQQYIRKDTAAFFGHIFSYNKRWGIDEERIGMFLLSTEQINTILLPNKKETGMFKQSLDIKLFYLISQAI